MKKHLAIIFLYLATVSAGFACDVCKEEQPEGLEEITHGTGPRAITDYIISWSAVIIVGISFLLSLKYIFRPQEKHSNHIKYIVLHQDFQAHE